MMRNLGKLKSYPAFDAPFLQVRPWKIIIYPEHENWRIGIISTSYLITTPPTVTMNSATSSQPEMLLQNDRVPPAPDGMKAIRPPYDKHHHAEKTM
jgi:hypothetical protein